MHGDLQHGLKEGDNHRTNEMLTNTSSFLSQIEISIYFIYICYIYNYNSKAQKSNPVENVNFFAVNKC